MKDWFLRNWGNVFGVLGLLATIYVGVYYVPSHIKESLTEKDRIINVDLIQATKELIYSDSISNLIEIQSLIDGKEVKYGMKYKYFTNELLLQTQEAFMEHKFLPLKKRKELVKEIEELKKQIKPNSGEVNIDDSKVDSFSKLKIWSSILISLLASLLAAISMYYKNRFEAAKSEEIKNQIETVKQSSNKTIRESAIEFEKSIIKTIKDELNIVENQENIQHDSSIDYKFKFNGLKSYVFIKYLTRSKIGLSTMQSFLYELVGRKGNAILVYNTDLTTMVLKEIENFKNDYPDINFLAIKAKNTDEFKSKFKKDLLDKKARA